MARLVTLLLLFALPMTAAHAYVGPGVGLGAIGVLIGVLASLVLAVVGIVWYPIKRLLKKRKKAQDASNDKAETDGQTEANGPTPTGVSDQNMP